MGLSFIAMGFAAFGLIPPIAGAILQEGIDVAVIVNALRVLRRPGSETPAATIPDQWTRQLHGDHAQLRAVLDEIRRAADELDGLDAVLRLHFAQEEELYSVLTSGEDATAHADPPPLGCGS